MTWRAVDAEGLDLGTGQPPEWPGCGGPVDALAATPVATWPLWVAARDGQRVDFGCALGPGGDRVGRLVDALVARRPIDDVQSLARWTPAGPVELPVEVVDVPAAAQAAHEVDATWLASVDRARTAARAELVATGRSMEAEAALHVALLLAAQRLDPADDTDVDAHVAAGGQLWLLGGAVVSALTGCDPDPFDPWARLVAAGWWPVGPVAGRLLLALTR